MNVPYYLILFIYNYVTVTVDADEVLGCGGFIKSHVPIDFSKVEVKLVTKQGIVKDTTSAAPNNGYYFVPLYDKGELILEVSPPPGWSFEPKQVVLSVDGVSDLCSQGKDINFVFQGFGITGKVESLGSESGPEGVIIQLRSNAEIKTVRATASDKDGNFFFTPVYPGNYTVSISHPKWRIFKKSVDVQVAESNTELPRKSLVVQGYDVKGKVKSEGEPVRNATVILFSKDEQKNVSVDSCDKEELKGVQFVNKILCHVTSKANGEFTFGTIPNGKYYIIPYFKGQNIYFQPERIEFTINNKGLELEESFEIIGFSVPGKIVKAKNIPIENAKIFVNGLEVAKTATNGVYKLEKMKTGTYKIKVQADDLVFAETIVKINPTLQELPNISPTAYKVCGEVTSDHSQTVTFTREDKTKLVQTATSPEDGSFCQYLTPGTYQVEVVVYGEDKQKGLQFFPLTQTIEVTFEKISNIVFSQLKSNISGKVQCIHSKDCEGLTVALKSGNEKEITLKVKDGSYAVSDMYPGTYEVNLLTNKFCWKTNKQIVNIISAKVEVPPFVQRGFTVTFMSSHNTQVHFKLPGQTSTTRFDIGKGRSSYCLEKPGEYQFNMESCHTYNPKNITYNTDSEVNEVLLIALKHTLKLYVQSETDVGNLHISVKIGTDKVNRVLKYNNGLYELDIILEPAESAVIIPHSDTLFLTPPILSVDGRDDCENLGVKFVAVKGKLFKGKVIPPLAGVTITVECTDTETLIIETDANGVFKFPPLDDKKEYTISAKKDSYVLSGPDKDGNFLAHKLAEVIVEVLDGADQSPLPGVLLSLSGGESYRRNLQSDENGKISFHSLSPSEYFLRPMMKEYKFEPSSKIILVNEGQTVSVKLIGKRVAYSAFGKVVSLNGEPEDNMIVIASGIGNCTHYSEETTCESSGKFRIRGLQPYCPYKIFVKGSADKRHLVERTAPEFIEVNQISEDIKGLKLIVFRPATQMDILVKVYADNVEHYKSLKVKVMRESGSSSVVHTAKIDTMSIKLTNDINPGVLLHIPALPIDNRAYSIQLETNLPQNLKFRPHIYNFNANSSFKFIELDFNAKSSITEQSIKQTSIWSLIFIFTVIFALYNIELLLSLLKDKFNFNFSYITNLIPAPTTSQKTATDYFDNAQIDQIVQSINNVKRKPKPKKA